MEITRTQFLYNALMHFTYKKSNYTDYTDVLHIFAFLFLQIWSRDVPYGYLFTNKNT